MTSEIEVKRVEFPGARVAALEHHGSEEALNEAVRRFVAWRRDNRLPPSASATFNIVHDSTSPASLRYDLCAAISGPVAPNALGVIEKQIPAGRCALLRHVGSEQMLGRAIHRLLADWLPASGERQRDAPLFLQRIRFPPDVAEHESITDIFLPLR